MIFPRSNFGIELLDGCVVVVGGIGSRIERPLKSVEKYVIETNKWSKVQAMSAARHGLGCTVVKDTKINILN